MILFYLCLIYYLYILFILQGGIIGVVIKWDCNLDFDKKYCFPTYEFTRLDDPNAKLAPGWNFRYSISAMFMYNNFLISLIYTIS